MWGDVEEKPRYISDVSVGKDTFFRKVSVNSPSTCLSKQWAHNIVMCPSPEEGEA